MRHITIIVFLVPMAYCTHNQKAVNTSIDSSYAGSSLVHTINSNPILHQDSTFQAFWKQFRSAVIQLDSTTLISMTAFPLKTRGYRDEDPQIDIDTNDFWKVFIACLTMETGGLVNETNLEFIKRIVNIENSREYDREFEKIDGQRITNFEFAKTNAGWKLTLIYLDTNELAPSRN